MRQFVRGGPLDPCLLLSLLLYLVRHGDLRGYSRVLEAFWDEAQSFGLALPTEAPVSKQAFSQARKKLPAELVRELFHTASDAFEREHGSEFRWHGRRLLAVDGARHTIQASEELCRTFGVPEGAHYPYLHLTTLFDVCSKVPLDVEIGRYGSDERAQLLRVMERCEPDDVLVLDKGYGAFDIFAAMIHAEVDFVCRMPASSTFTAVVDFAASGVEDATITLDAPSRSVLRGTEPIELRAVRVERHDGSAWIILTTLSAEDFTAADIADAYTRRWNVEEYYKLLVANYFGQGLLHAKSAQGVRQEIYAQMLFVVLTRNTAAIAAQFHNVPYDELSQKAAILAVGDHLTRIVLRRPAASARRDLERLLLRIARAREKPRSGRSAPRRSLQPKPKWGPKGRTSGR